MPRNKNINPNLHREKKELNVQMLFNNLRAGTIAALSQAITLIESTNPRDVTLAQELITKALPYSGNSFRLGITGVPGVGKSTFIEALGTHIIKAGHKLAVLAIDPSSSVTKGSILGDKTRMEQLVKSDKAFIRPSPAGTTLGGVARKTREAIILCEAAGYDFIIVETVGVGQSETAVHSMTDFFLLLQLAGAGDDLQGIKRGIMEMADALVINKADGDNLTAARHAQRHCKNAIHMMPAKDSGWPVDVHTCSGLNNEGIDTLFTALVHFKNHSHDNRSFTNKRNNQELYWLHQSIENALLDNFYTNVANQELLKNLEKQVLARTISPFEAARKALEL